MVAILRLAALSLAIVAIGCGSDGREEPSASTSTPTESETQAAEAWVSDVVAICRENRRRAQEGVRELQQQARSQALSETEFAARVLELSIDNTRPIIDELETLPLPEGREEQAERFTEVLGETLPVFERTVRALRANDREAAGQANEQIRELASESRQLARELEIDQCIPPNSRG